MAPIWLKKDSIENFSIFFLINAVIHATIAQLNGKGLKHGVEPRDSG
jgi:hypothetical protein